MPALDADAVSANAETGLGAIEDERHDQVFLVIEVPPEPPEQRRAGGRVRIRCRAQRVSIVHRRAQESVGRVHGAVDRLVDRVVIVLQHLETTGEPRLRRLEDRKVVKVLDLVVRVELLQEELQPGRKPGPEVLRARSPIAEGGGCFLERPGDVAEHVVPREPKLRHGAEIGMSLPHRARIAVDQEPQLGRPAVSDIECERRGYLFLEFCHPA